MAGAPWRGWRSGHRRQAFGGDKPTPGRREPAPDAWQATAKRLGDGRVPRLLGQSRGYWKVPTIDLPDDEIAAVTAAIRGAIEDAKYPLSPRLDALKAALARLDAASNSAAGPKPPPHPTRAPTVAEPKASPAAKGKRTRR
jgi:hypothetical protein